MSCKSSTTSTETRPTDKTVRSSNSEASIKSTKNKTLVKKYKHFQSDKLDFEIHRLISSPAQYRFQPVCTICEVYSNVPGQMLKCQGSCGRILHLHCMRYNEPPPLNIDDPAEFKCPQCIKGAHVCTTCGEEYLSDIENKSDLASELLACQVTKCRRLFHRKCVKGLVGTTLLEDGNEALVRCPAHVCTTCYLEKSCDDNFTEDQPLLHCVRCPRSFHTGDLCTPAGSVEVSLSHIVCPMHFTEKLSLMASFKPNWPSWCFICRSSGGEKVMCERCPSTYHKSCLPISEIVDASGCFTCSSCRRGLQPRYAQIVWAKIPCFRWWPCEVIHARNAPMNILNMKHPEGTFLIHFAGSGEYQWVARGQVFAFEIGLNTAAAKSLLGSSKKEAAFNLSLRLAPRAHEFYVNYVWRRNLPLTSAHVTRLSDEELLPMSTPETAVALGLTARREDDALQAEQALSTFKQISSNQFFHSSTQSKVIHTEPISPCQCADDASLCCRLESRCPNVLASVECSPITCSVLAKGLQSDCGNRFVAAPPSTTVFRTVNRGYGLKILKTVTKDAFVIEFLGEVIDVKEANLRLKTVLSAKARQRRALTTAASHPLNRGDLITYLLRFTTDLVIDAKAVGNLARFINHSCEPNLYSKCFTSEGTLRLGLFALSDISEDTELTLDYRSAELLDLGLATSESMCLCGTDSCSVMLGLPTIFTAEATHSSDSGQPTCQVTPSQQSPTPSLSPTPSSLSTTKANKKKASLALAQIEASQSETATITCAAPGLPTEEEVTDRATAVNQNMSTNLVPASSKVHEDFCYRCGDGGGLMLCDMPACPKSFHSSCLGLLRIPTDTWYCPWHYCDDCGQPSTHLCWRCPNSYCADHADHRIGVDEVDADRLASFSGSRPGSMLNCRWICRDHADLRIIGPGHRPRLEASLGEPALELQSASSECLRQTLSPSASRDPPDAATQSRPPSLPNHQPQLRARATGAKRQTLVSTPSGCTERPPQKASSSPERGAKRRRSSRSAT